ncbi:unnamed protein product [Rhodiola kirilowii]
MHFYLTKLGFARYLTEDRPAQMRVRVGFGPCYLIFYSPYNRVGLNPPVQFRLKIMSKPAH